MASIIGDKIKLSNFGYVIEPKNYSAGKKVSNEFITNPNYVITYSGSRRYWEKTVDAFDIDWRPYGMEVEDWNESTGVWDKKTINFENVEDIFDVMRHGLSYAVLAKEAQNVAGFISTGKEVFSKYTSIENIWVDSSTNNVSYTYSQRPFIFASKNDISKSNVVNGNSNTLGTSTALSYSLIFGSENVLSTKGKTNIIFGDKNKISSTGTSNNAYNLILGYNNELKGNDTSKGILIGSDNIIASLHNSLVIGKENNIKTDLNDSIVVSHLSTINKIYNSNVNLVSSNVTNINYSNIIAGNVQTTAEVTYTNAIFNGTVNFGENLNSLTGDLIITNNNATLGGTYLNDSVLIGETLTTNNLKNSIILGKNITTSNGDGSLVVGTNISASNGKNVLIVGDNLNSSSENESVIGKYNVAHPSYLFSIGNGVSGERHNALTVLKNGTFTIEKLNVDFYENIIYYTHNQAVLNKLQGRLQPGRLYCIYDFCSEILENTKGITTTGKNYPLILLAISPSEFSTNAWMIIGNHPFRGSKLYIDPTVNSYYVNVGLTKQNDGSVKWRWILRTNGNFNQSQYILTEKPSYPFIDSLNTFDYSNDLKFTKFEYYDGADTGVYNSSYPNLGIKHVEIKYDILYGEHQYSNEYILSSNVQKGFIYWMKDEYGNEADFDLYSIKFDGAYAIQNNSKHNKLFNTYNVVLNNSDYNNIYECYNISLTNLDKNEIKNSNNIQISCSNSEIKNCENITISVSSNKFKLESCKNINITNSNYNKDSIIQMFDIEDKTNIEIPNIDGPLIYRSSKTREILL